MFYFIVVITFLTLCLAIPTYMVIRENFITSPRYNLCMIFMAPSGAQGVTIFVSPFVRFKFVQSSKSSSFWLRLSLENSISQCPKDRQLSFSNVSRNPSFIPSEIVMRRDMALNRNSRGSNENQMFLHLLNRFQNVPVVRSFNLNKVKASKESCSIYPNILDINFSNKYWQIFKIGSSTLHLYGAYFGKFFRFCKRNSFSTNWSSGTVLVCLNICTLRAFIIHPKL